MGDSCSKMERPERDRNRRGEPSEQETELQHLPPNRAVPRRSGETNLIPEIPVNVNVPPQQTQTVGPKSTKSTKSTPIEVRGEDFNDYMRVDKVEGKSDPINTKHEVGHSFSACFKVTNTTSDYLKFTDSPRVEWNEIIHKKDGAEGKMETEQFDQYAKKPKSATFIGWRWGWEETIAPNATKQIIIQDNARVTDIDKNDRTVSRSIEFEIGVPGNGPGLKATQKIEVINGVMKELDFKIH